MLYVVIKQQPAKSVLLLSPPKSQIKTTDFLVVTATMEKLEGTVVIFMALGIPPCQFDILLSAFCYSKILGKQGAPG